MDKNEFNDLMKIMFNDFSKECDGKDWDCIDCPMDKEVKEDESCFIAWSRLNINKYIE